MMFQYKVFRNVLQARATIYRYGLAEYQYMQLMHRRTTNTALPAKMDDLERGWFCTFKLIIKFKFSKEGISQKI